MSLLEKMFADVEFAARCRVQFEGFVHSLNESVSHSVYEGQFIGYLQPSTQARWCAWCEALEHAPVLLGREACEQLIARSEVAQSEIEIDCDRDRA